MWVLYSDDVLLPEPLTTHQVLEHARLDAQLLYHVVRVHVAGSGDGHYVGVERGEGLVADWADELGGVGRVSVEVEADEVAEVERSGVDWILVVLLQVWDDVPAERTDTRRGPDQ